ncbi:hypothetical protein MnTg02_00291 [bacterium MnTg02]|nr:hypothetical protein MnTg02_00291 [bacterium MnTg02]
MAGVGHNSGWKPDLRRELQWRIWGDRELSSGAKLVGQAVAFWLKRNGAAGQTSITWLMGACSQSRPTVIKNLDEFLKWGEHGQHVHRSEKGRGRRPSSYAALFTAEDVGPEYEMRSGKSTKPLEIASGKMDEPLGSRSGKGNEPLAESDESVEVKFETLAVKSEPVVVNGVYPTNCTNITNREERTGSRPLSPESPKSNSRQSAWWTPGHHDPVEINSRDFGAGTNSDLAKAQSDIWLNGNTACLEISDDYRRELLNSYSTLDIKRGLERAETTKKMSPFQLKQKLNRACSYAKGDRQDRQDTINQKAKREAESSNKGGVRGSAIPGL